MTDRWIGAWQASLPTHLPTSDSTDEQHPQITPALDYSYLKGILLHFLEHLLFTHIYLIISDHSLFPPTFNFPVSHFLSSYFTEK